MAGRFYFRQRLVFTLAVLGMAGCAQVDSIKSKVGDAFGKDSSAQSTAAADTNAQDASQPLSLSAITNTYLLHGRYAEGEQRLRQYLAKYPNDRAAQGLLRQLTADPKTVLGAQSRAYVVQPGDSYSTLAARNLGDSNQFLILARYNGSTNPSALRAGDSVRMPMVAPRITTASSDAAPSKASRNTATAPDASVAPATDASVSGESSAAKAQRLQSESSALLKQGQKDQALNRLDQALNIDPHLKADGNQALRQQLLASYHERAVVLYRDQKLDQAIALWDHVLAIDPNYERAVIFRARAVELKSRLQQI